MQVAVWDSHAYAEVANSRFQSLEGSAQADSHVDVGKGYIQHFEHECSWRRPHTTRYSKIQCQAALLASTCHGLPRGAVLLLPHPVVTEQLP
jgi:hypothetical protein